MYIIYSQSYLLFSFIVYRVSYVFVGAMIAKSSKHSTRVIAEGNAKPLFSLSLPNLPFEDRLIPGPCFRSSCPFGIRKR